MKASLIMIVLIIVLFVVFAGEEALAYRWEHDYVIDAGGHRVPIPITYTATKVIDYFGTAGSLSNPQDLFIDKHDNIYVADTGNNRIIKIDPYVNEVQIYIGKDRTKIREPNGIFVDDYGDLFIADTGNARILHLSKYGDFIEEFTEPESELYDDINPFRPLKVAIDPLGQIYVINEESYLGFVVIDAFNRFRGYVAPTRLEFRFIDQIVRLFATEEQKARIGRRVPPVHSNFYMTGDGMIYATTARALTQQLKVISPLGDNVFPKTGAFGDTRGDYILRHFGKEWIEPKFVDISVDRNGIINILDNVTGRIFQYDKSGQLLTVFGGTGNWAGKMLNASSLDIDSRGRIHVLDAGFGVIHIFEPTSFIRTVHEALSLYFDGKYVEAVGLWEEVLSIDNNYPVAHIGTGKAYLKQNRWLEAMTAYKTADVTSGYSIAFNELRHEFFRNYFGVVIFSFIVSIAMLVFIISSLKKKAMAASILEPQKMRYYHTALLIIFDPPNGFRSIKSDRTNFQYGVPIFILLATVVSRIAALNFTHFPLAAADPGNINLLQEISAIILPFLTWVIASYLVTTICAGESMLREVFSATAYSLIPYVIFTVPVSLISNMLSSTDAALYGFFGTITAGWIVILFLVNLHVMNSYNLKETFKIAILSLFACIFMWAVLALIYILGLKLFEFVSQVILELRLLLFV